MGTLVSIDAAPVCPPCREIRIGDVCLLVADPKMGRLYDLIQNRLARSELPILVQGETGTGKELVARAVHAWSPRADHPLVALNCGAIPDTLVESELFGYRRGAFTGAEETREGLVEAADGGTLFLDEIGDLSLPAQAKVLRVLEEGRFRRVGDTLEQDIDIRVIAATHINLEAAVQDGRFRRDLYFRLKGALFIVPPLRRRPADLRVLAMTFIEKGCAGAGRRTMTVTEDGWAAITSYRWPGNVRELSSALNYITVTAEEDELQGHHVWAWIEGMAQVASTCDIGEQPEAQPEAFQPLATEIADLERRRMTQALEAAEHNRTSAARLIGMPLRTFTTKMKQYHLEK